MYIASGILIALFCVGYTQMSRRIIRPGAFYAYISRGLGKTSGVSAAWLALASYIPFTAGCFAIAPYYASLIIKDQLHVHVPWPLYAVFLFVTVGVAAYRKIDFSAKILAFFVSLEVVCLVVLNVTMIAKDGFHLMPADTLSPHVAFSGGFGVALVFAVMSFVGFESAALYAPETKNPRRAIPRATYAAVFIIAILYGVSTWQAVGVFGKDGVKKAAFSQFGDLYFGLAQRYVGHWLVVAMSLLMLVAQWAVALAITNATARYTHALAHEKLLPSWLGRTHQRFHSPMNALLFLLLVSAVMIFGGWAIGLDPYLDISSVSFGVGIVGIVAIQAAASLSVIVFFLRERDGFHWWKTLLAPLLACLGLAASVALMVHSFSVVAGKDNRFVGSLPWVLLVVVVLGAAYAQILKHRDRRTYEMLGEGDATSEFDDVVSTDIWEEATSA
jgi:amino acid transporter